MITASYLMDTNGLRDDFIDASNINTSEYFFNRCVFFGNDCIDAPQTICAGSHYSYTPVMSRRCFALPSAVVVR